MRREARFKAKMDDSGLTWTMSMTFYALSGGCVCTSKTGEQRVLRRDAIAYLEAFKPQSLLQLQRVVLQDPGMANAIGKAITRIQAFWFCSQCIVRLSENLAVSLLELNTFAHCISTLLIYVFWWDKPYDAKTLIFIESKALDLYFLLELNEMYDSVPSPLLGLPRKIDRVSEVSGTYSISDTQGNRLVCGGKPLILPFHGNTNYEDPDYLRVRNGSRTRIADTGLYLSFELSISVPGPIYIMSWRFYKDRLNCFWSA